MSRKRKTVDVEYVKEQANHMLLHSPDDMTGDRHGVIIMIEKVLMSTGNYRGYDYLNERDMKKSYNGTSRGVNDFNQEDQRWDFTGTDDTRREYA